MIDWLENRLFVAVFWRIFYCCWCAFFVAVVTHSLLLLSRVFVAFFVAVVVKPISQQAKLFAGETSNFRFCCFLLCARGNRGKNNAAPLVRYTRATRPTRATVVDCRATAVLFLLLLSLRWDWSFKHNSTNSCNKIKVSWTFIFNVKPVNSALKPIIHNVFCRKNRVAND